MSRQKVGTVAVQKCTPTVDHEGSRWITVSILPTHVYLGKLYLKLQKFMTCSYSIQIIHVSMHWNFLENGDETYKLFLSF
jgi:hypothetical protein